jgi:hypothetical protein
MFSQALAAAASQSKEISKLVKSPVKASTAPVQGKAKQSTTSTKSAIPNKGPGKKK